MLLDPDPGQPNQINADPDPGPQHVKEMSKSFMYV